MQVDPALSNIQAGQFPNSDKLAYVVQIVKEQRVTAATNPAVPAWANHRRRMDSHIYIPQN
jgi:hypothetical protein